VKGFKCFLIHPGCDGFKMVTLPQLKAALPHVASTGLPLLVHAELQGPIDAAAPQLEAADWHRYETYLQSRPDEAEIAAIRLLLQLCREYRFRLHIVHLATAMALPELREAKAAGLPVTVETCPHYLYFAAEEIRDGSTLHKCAPPIRGRANREALWDGLRDRVIDLIATDHSPCPPSWKRLEEGRFDKAWGGIASLSAALPVMWTALRARGFTLLSLVGLMAHQPAKLAGLTGRKGTIAAGCDADLVVFHPEAERVYTRHLVSPYIGETLQGKVVATYLRGRKVFDGGSFVEQPFGREV
jgi:allantoinase